MGVSSELGDSICKFLQEFDSRVGVVCCTSRKYIHLLQKAANHELSVAKAWSEVSHSKPSQHQPYFYQIVFVWLVHFECFGCAAPV